MVIVVILVVSVKFVLYRNFTDYLNRLDLQKMDTLEAQLKDEYQRHGGWRHLRERSRLWRELLDIYLARDLGLSVNRPLMEAEAYTDRPPREDRPPPPERRNNRMPGSEPTFREPPPPPPSPPLNDPNRVGPRLSLFDLNKNIVAGPANSVDHHTLQAIRIDDEIIGWLGLQHRDESLNPMSMAYLRQQNQSVYFIGGCILGIAAIVSLLLSRHILAPVKQLMRGTAALTRFDFDTRIDVRTTDELGELARNFNQMAETLRQYETLRQQWLTDISHELRTPLAILRGEIEAIQDGIRKADPDNIASLHAEILHIAKLVDNLHFLSLADSENLRRRIESVKIEDVLRESFDRFRERLKRNGIDVQYASGEISAVIIRGDKEQMGQLFCNLFENTLKYTSSPGILRIRASVIKNRVEIRFEDSEPGVPSNAVPRLFDRLYRVDKSRSRAMGGSGLGLAICKQIVESHRGTITADHSALGGLSVTVSLPLE